MTSPIATADVAPQTARDRVAGVSHKVPTRVAAFHNSDESPNFVPASRQYGRQHQIPGHTDAYIDDACAYCHSVEPRSCPYERVYRLTVIIWSRLASTLDCLD